MNAAEMLERTIQVRQNPVLLGTSSHQLLQSFLSQMRVAASYARGHATVHKLAYCDIEPEFLRVGGGNLRDRLNAERVLTEVDPTWFRESLRTVISQLKSDHFIIHLHLRLDGEDTIVPDGKPLFVKGWCAHLVVGWADENWYHHTLPVAVGETQSV